MQRGDVSAVFTAVMEHDLPALKNFLEDTKDVDAVEPETGYALLHRTCQAGFEAGVFYLLQQGCDVRRKAVQQCDWEPLHIAVISGHNSCAKRLLDFGAWVDPLDHYGLTPLCYAARAGNKSLVRLLLQSSASAEHVDRFGCSPLHYAAGAGTVPIVKRLIKEHCNVNLADCFGKSPLYWATQYNHIDVVRLLLARGAVLKIDKDSSRLSKNGTIQSSVIHEAIQTGNLTLLQLFLEQPEGYSLISTHSQELDGYIVKSKFPVKDCLNLLKICHFDDVTDAKKKQVFSTCFLQDDHSLKQVAWMTLFYLKKIQWLDDFSRELHRFLDVGGLTVFVTLFEQAMRCDIPITELLKRAPRNLCENENLPRLLLQSAITQGKAEYISALLNQLPYDINLPDSKNETLLHHAAYQNQLECARILITAGAKYPSQIMPSPLFLAIESDAVEVIKLFVEKFGNEILLPHDEQNNGIFHYCVMYNAEITLTYLLQISHHIERSNLNVDCQNFQHQTALHLTVISGSLMMLNILYRYHANVNMRDEDGNTPLHLGIQHQKKNIVQCLLELGASLQIPNRDNMNPKVFAERKYPTMLKVINYTQLNLTRRRRKWELGNTDTTINSLVFQGGGVKGIAYLGALQQAVADKFINLNNIRRIAGTSAGSMIAMLLCLDYSLDDVQRLLSELDLEQMLDDVSYREMLFTLKSRDNKFVKNFRSLFFSEGDLWTKLAYCFDGTAFQLFSQGHQLFRNIPDLKRSLEKTRGLFDGDKLLECLAQWIANKIDDKYLTFAELADRTTRNPRFKKLYVVGYNLNQKRIEIFSHEHTPNMLIADAIRISTSIPIFFKPHQAYIKCNGERVISELDYYVDGGIAYNYPIDIFDSARYIHPSVNVDHAEMVAEDAGRQMYNDQVLGFSLVSSALGGNRPPESGGQVVDNPDGFFAFIKCLAYGVISVEDSLLALNRQNLHRSVYINTYDVSAVDFDLDHKQKELLVLSGKDAMRDYVSKATHSVRMNSLVVSVLLKHAKARIVGSLSQMTVSNVQLKKSPELIYDLALAAKEDLSRWLENYHLSVTLIDDEGNSAFHIAVAKGDLETLQRLHRLHSGFISHGSESLIDRAQQCLSDQAREQILDFLAEYNDIHRQMYRP